MADFYFEKDPNIKENSSSDINNEDKNRYLSGKRAAIKATMGTMGKEEMQQTQYQIRVKMNVEQSDMPAGLQKMMNNMVRNIEDQ